MIGSSTRCLGKNPRLGNSALWRYILPETLKSFLIASGNVKGESLDKGEFFADKLEYTLASKILDFSMFGDNQVNLKLKR